MRILPIAALIVLSGAAFAQEQKPAPKPAAEAMSDDELRACGARIAK